MLQNAYLLAKIGADTAENERNFAEISSGRVRIGFRRFRGTDVAKDTRKMGIKKC